MNLFEKAKNYAHGVRIITELFGSSGHCADPILAQGRANICLHCPKNIQSGIVTQKAAEIVREQLELKKNLNLRVAGEKSLGKCEACLCELKLKVWVPIERILPQPGDEFDPGCWILKEANDRSNPI